MNIILQATLLTATLAYVGIKDCMTREIPNKFCVWISLLSLLDFRVENLLGLGISFVLWLTAAYIAPDKLGGGDIKLSAAVSVVLGFQATAYGMVIGLGMVSIIWLAMLTQKSKREVASHSLPLAPFLGLGFLITYFTSL